MKLQYDVNREAAKMWALSSGKNYKYEYLTGEEILTSKQRQVKQQPKFTYFPLGKSFWKTNRNDSRARKKTNRCYYELKR